MSGSVVTLDQAGSIATITLNRPQVLNAMDDALLEGLAYQLGVAR